MKKHLFSLWVLIFAISTLTAQINREMVLVEIGTGTGCGYCPGAAMGLHDLYANGDPVAGIEYHSYNSSDPFNTPEAATRTSYYGVSGYPTAKFDGEYDEHVGGSTSTSVYSTYLPKVNTRMAMQTNFSVEILGENTGNNYDIIVRVEKFGTYTGTNLKVRFALTETDIPYTWQGQSLIEYCERLMAPDANGTAVSFTSGNTQDVNLNFVFDNTWVDSNCELIAWIQDDANKYVLHSASVMLLDLQPDVATSNFTSDTNQVCEGNTIQFTDLSSGAITGWNWTFEGGNPNTSTLQNPVVTYNTQGTYDVTLEVTDGTTTSTLTQTDMIEIIVAPVQPNQPVGETTLCNSETTIYTTNEVPYSDSYAWQVSPSNAGTLTPNGVEATFVASSSYVGNYTISVRADNSCGNGTWSTPLSCIMNYAPLQYQLSNGGGICEGSQGIELTQAGSEINIEYELFRDGNSTSTILPGTGNPLSFGFINIEGTYTVIGYNTTCDVQMYGTPWIYYLDTPSQPNIPDGPSMSCKDTLSTFNINTIDYADTIYWVLSPENAGTLFPDNLSVDVQWSDDFAGIANLTAQGSNDCGDGTISDPAEIMIEDSPSPEISGLNILCDNESSDYSVVETEENSYEWIVSGGEITSGAGTANVTVLWGNPGTGILQVIETSTNECSGVSEEYEVTIDDCTSIDENNENSVSIYPNPGSSKIDIEFVLRSGQSYQVVIYNTLGQLIDKTEGIAFGNQQKVNFNISNFKPGLYVVNIISENGLNIRSTFEKAK